MSTNSYAARENLTLTEADLFACRPISGENSRVLRAFCPFHGGDHQRSLRVEVETGHFTCFACGAWGYTEDARRRWGQEQRQEAEMRRSQEAGKGKSLSSGRSHPRRGCRPGRADPAPPFPAPSPSPVCWTPARVETSAPMDLAHLLRAYQEALPGSLGEEYLCQRGIPLSLARAAGVGYAAPGAWPHKSRDWKWGRLVFPHTTPDEGLVNLYGRAVGADEKVPKEKRHDHLPGGGEKEVPSLCARGPSMLSP